MARNRIRSTLGLRERKKAKTRSLIQRHALRLFREQGFEATSISEIAAAAEISESTFFRYFPTKVDMVRWDPFDPQIIKAFRAQPTNIPTITALRRAFHKVLNRLSAEERVELRQRMLLALAIPQALGAEQLGGPMQMLAGAVAKRARRRPEDFGAQVMVGAVLGAGIAAMLAAADHPEADIVVLLDEALAHLEAGFSI